ncbi:hypothetical protein [Devosia ginsengisoli]|uniref:hypothetical protein n=1 Tax=Devosia ginsengisoli TaxID=400770 RepID=UPI0026F3158F|nr:hypothetical protein [Devosia ginsengisoli]MCR6673285.1 hypothetical protein [Devosia ginsengisoli]
MIIFQEPTAEQIAAVIDAYARAAAPYFQQGDIDLEDRSAVIARLAKLGYSGVADAIADRTVEIARLVPPDRVATAALRDARRLIEFAETQPFNPISLPLAFAAGAVIASRQLDAAGSREALSGSRKIIAAAMRAAADQIEAMA